MTGHLSRSFKTGDAVTWNTSQGETHGTVEDKQTSDTHIKNHTVRESASNPRYIVKSGKSGKSAAHKPEKLNSIIGENFRMSELSSRALRQPSNNSDG